MPSLSSYVLRFWAKNKKSLYKYTNNSLSYTIPITLNSNISSSIEKFLGENDSLYQDFLRLNPQFAQFLSIESLSTNLYKGPTFSHILPNGKVFRVQNGCKVIKTFAKIAEAHNLPSFQNFINKHSLILNDKNPNKILHFSIDPYDFCAMGDSQCGWRTCYSWEHDGGSKQATIELMNSPHVLLAYLTEDGNPDKKLWRQYFFIDETQGIFPSRSYPYVSNEITEKVLSLLKANFPQELKEVKILPSKSISLIANFVYNDWAHYNSLMPCLVTEEKEKYYLDVDAVNECISCGSTSIPHSKRLLCRNCDPMEFCIHCGFHFHYTNMVEIEPGFYVCDSCYEDDYGFCKGCGTSYLYNYIKTIHVTDNKGREIQSIELCDRCAGSNQFYFTSDALPFYKGYLINKNKLRPKGLKLLNTF